MAAVRQQWVRGALKYEVRTMAEERQQGRERAHRLGQDLFELSEQIKATEGYRIQLKIRTLRSSYYVFEGNYRTLVSALDYFGRIEVFMELWKEDNRAKLESFIDEVTRRLHNFLAGAKTLVDHTRVFKNEMYKGHRFEKVYLEKLHRDLSRSPVVRFVQDLRNYVLHKQLPIASAELSFKRGEGTSMEFDSTIKLDVNKLREWDGWKPESRVYLDTLDDKVQIREVVEKYEAAIRSFYQWFGEQQEQLHRVEFDELSELETQYEQVRQEWE
jgi:hypothetical protein